MDAIWEHPSTVFVVSADALMASALSTVLSGEFGPSVEQAPTSAAAAARCAEQADRDEGRSVIVVDLAQTEAPDPALRAELVAANTRARVIVVAPVGPFDGIRALLELGVHGIVGRDADPEELVRAVAEAAADNVFVSRRMLRRLVDHVVRCTRREADTRRWEPLASRESEIVELLTRGMTNREIARELHLSEATVKAHLGRVMTKWQVRDRLQVVLHALDRNP